MDLSFAIIEHEPFERQHDINIECASHLRLGLDPEHRRLVTQRVCSLLKKMQKQGLQFDAIAARGLSGLLFAPVIAMNLNKTLLIVRKGERCHSSRGVEGDYGARNYIIVDDFISSGLTVATIVTEIALGVPLAQCVGMVCYSGIEEDTRWVGWSHANREQKYFTNERELRSHSNEIRHQRKRVTDKWAEIQSQELGALAKEEKRARDPKPPFQSLFYNPRV